MGSSRVRVRDLSISLNMCLLLFLIDNRESKTFRKMIKIEISVPREVGRWGNTLLTAAQLPNLETTKATRNPTTVIRPPYSCVVSNASGVMVSTIIARIEPAAMVFITEIL